jgi:hypothetical protein
VLLTVVAVSLWDVFVDSAIVFTVFSVPFGYSWESYVE